MTTGDLHEIAPNLVVIEGHHPHAMWEDPDLPTIAAYRGERTLCRVRHRRRARAARGPAAGRGATQFADAVDTALRRRPDGVTIDDLAADLAATAEPGSIVALLLRLQFPVFSTFFKLTLLNHCLLHALPQGRDAAGRPTFRAA